MLTLSWQRVAWLFIIMVGLSLRLGHHALIDPDEGRNAAIGLEMARTGDVLVPTLNGLPFLDKPLLFFAAEATAIRLFGAVEFAPRLPSLLFSWATVAVTAWFAAWLFGGGAGWVAGVACATAPLVIAFSRTAIFDSMLSFFVVVATIALFHCIESRATGARARSRRWSLLAWLAMALGLLTKGPVAIVIPLIIAVPFSLWRRQLLAVAQPAGWGLMLAIVVPWAWATERAVPGFLRYVLVTETWQRLTTDQMNRTGPIWYFVPYLVGGAFPWSFLALSGGRRWWREVRGRRAAPATVFLALWVLLPLLFFSFSQSKRPQYILPLIPAVALLSAYAWSQQGKLRGVRAAACGWLLLGALMFVVASGALPAQQSLEWELGDAIQTSSWILCILAIAAGSMAWLSGKRPDDALFSLSLPLVLLPLALSPVVDVVAKERSGKALASALQPHLTETTTILGLETFSPSLTFYLDRPIVLASSTGTALTSNYITRSYATLVDTKATLTAPDTWWQSLGRCQDPVIFLLRPSFLSERKVLDAVGLPVIFKNRKLLAQGPCTPVPLADEEDSS